MGEAYGYRIQDELMVAAAKPVAKAATNCSTETSVVNDLKSQIESLTQKVDQLSSQRVNRPYSNYRNQRPRRFDQNNSNTATQNSDSTGSQQRILTCHKCKGQKHFIRNCNWNGQGQCNPNVQCQLCSQFGHIASQCTQLVNTGNRATPGDTGHAPPGDGS